MPSRAQAAADATPCWPGAGLGDDALRAEPLGEQRLADRVVDLVRARVGEVLALEPHLGAPAPRQLARQRERRRPADPGAQLRLELGAEARLAQVGAHALLEPVERRHQRLGHVAAAERPVAAARVGKRAAQRLRQQRLAVDLQGLGSHRRFSSTDRAALRLAGGPDEFTDQRRVLHAALALDAGAHVHAERAHRAHRLRRRWRDRARRPAPAASRAPARAAALQSARSPAPLRALSNRQRAGSGAGSRLRRSRSTGSTRCPRGRRSAARSPASVCSQSGAIASSTASTSACDGCRNTATRSTPGGTAALQLARRSGARLRGDASWNTKPTASAPARRRGLDRPARAQAADLDPQRRHRRLTAGPCGPPPAVRRTRARRVVTAHQARCRPARADSRARATRAASAGVCTPLSATAGQSSGMRPRRAREAVGVDLRASRGRGS